MHQNTSYLGKDAKKVLLKPIKPTEKKSKLEVAPPHELLTWFTLFVYILSTLLTLSTAYNSFK